MQTFPRSNSLWGALVNPNWVCACGIKLFSWDKVTWRLFTLENNCAREINTIYSKWIVADCYMKCYNQILWWAYSSYLISGLAQGLGRDQYYNFTVFLSCNAVDEIPHKCGVWSLYSYWNNCSLRNSLYQSIRDICKRGRWWKHCYPVSSTPFVCHHDIACMYKRDDASVWCCFHHFDASIESCQHPWYYYVILLLKISCREPVWCHGSDAGLETGRTWVLVLP